MTGGDGHSGETSDPAGGPADPVADMTDEHAADGETADPASPAAAGEPTTDESTPSTALNALIGGVVTGATVPLIPFSPVFGGGVAGYLQGGSSGDGATVGVLSGIVATIPLALLALVALLFVPVPTPDLPAPPSLALVGIVLAFIAAYVVGFSALGGVLGAYLKREL